MQETKTDETDDIYIDGYKTFMFCRKKLTNYRSGGIALLVRNSIASYVHVEKSEECKLVHFFTISKEIYGSCNSSHDEDLKCGIVYIPPHGSKYSYLDPFFEIQNEMIRFFSNSKHCLLFGDLNARCGTLQDYTRIDDFITDYYDLQILQDEESEIFRNFELHNIPLNRNTVDDSTNNYGHQLIDLCKNNNIFLWNGRVCSDYDYPKLTCKNASTVDYVLSTAFVFENVIDFKIEEFNSLYSDVHCPVYAVLRSKQSLVDEQFDNTPEKTPKITTWDRNKADLYSDNLDITKIADVEIKLCRLYEGNDISQNDIDDIVSDIAALFMKCSEETFGTRSKDCRSSPKSTNSKFPRFDRSCNEMRNMYHKTRKAYNKYKTQYFKDLLKTVSKQYKLTLRQANSRYKTVKIEKLRKLKNADPKKYWNILNENNHKSETTATLDSFYEFFRKLNENDYTQDENQTIDHSTNVVNNEINGPITEQEIQKAIKNLKNNKAPGHDEIINEQIKNSLSLMAPIYKKLFNIIFDTGIIPESWTIGLIKPIYKNKGDPRLPENYRPISLLSCLGKLFTCVLNNRLNEFAEKTNLIKDTQAGFRRDFSTVDNIFVLKSIIDIVYSNKKKAILLFR